MSEKELREMVKLFIRLQTLLDKSKKTEDHYEEDEENPISIPSKIYDDICYELGTDEIKLMGIS